jgi:hypothetical protein
MAKVNKFAHVKIVMAGLLTTRSLVRETAEFIWRNADKKTRQQALMHYFYSLGVPTDLKFGAFANLIDTVFPPQPSGMGVDIFPINIDYDQDNCHYSALIQSGLDLDTSA